MAHEGGLSQDLFCFSLGAWKQGMVLCYDSLNKRLRPPLSSIYPYSPPFSAQDTLSSSTGASAYGAAQIHRFKRNPDFFLGNFFEDLREVTYNGFPIGETKSGGPNPQLLRWIFSKYSHCPTLGIWVDRFVSSPKTDCSLKWVIESTQVFLGLCWVYRQLDLLRQRVD